MRFLVTGAAGLVGCQVVKDLVNDSHTVYSAYNDSKPLQGEPIKLNLEDIDQISKTIKETRPDSVIHLAAMTNVDKCEREPELAMRINADATEYLARQSASAGSYFLYVSTDYVFDGINGMKKEDDLPNPAGAYGSSKLEGEKRIQDMASPWCIARTSTPFGLHQKKKSFPLFVLESLKENREIPVLVDQFTSPTYVPNLSRMIIELATKQILGLFHTAGATRISRYETAELVAEKAGLDKKYLKPATMDQMNSWTAKRPKDSSLDVTRIFSVLDEKPTVIDHALDHFLSEVNKK